MSGWVFIDKPPGATSFSVVRDVRRWIGVRRVGHTGTLDPLASGVLVVAIGEACKLASYVCALHKTYTFRVVWGEERTTDDAEGAVVHTSPKRPTLADVQKIIPRFCGEIEQRPPRYCAVNIQGQRAYSLARKGADFIVPLRTVVIKSLVVHTCTHKGAEFVVECSSGTYVRALGRDMAHALGTCGYVDCLRRISLGSVTLEHCEAVGTACVMPVDALWDPEKVIVVSEACLRELSQGKKVPYAPLPQGSLLVRAVQVLPACVAVWRDGFLESKRFLHSASGAF